LLNNAWRIVGSMWKIYQVENYRCIYKSIFGLSWEKINFDVKKINLHQFSLVLKEVIILSSLSHIFVVFVCLRSSLSFSSTLRKNGRFYDVFRRSKCKIDALVNNRSPHKLFFYFYLKAFKEKFVYILYRYLNF